MSKNKSLIQIGIFFVLCVSFLAFGSDKAMADALIDKSDAMTRLGNSSSDPVFSDHTILFTTPTGVAAGEAIVITLPSDFNGETDPDGNLDYTDVDMSIESSPDGLCGGAAATLLDSNTTASSWLTEFSDTDSRVLTFTSGGASATVGAGYEVCIEIGENATGGSANSQYANPTTSGSKTIGLSVGDGADTGDIIVRIIDNDRVTISATVIETISFSISDSDVGFGNLSITDSRFATGDTLGADGPDATSAHTMNVATNGASGYGITYNGATLTYDTSDIDVATITGDEDGEPGTEQFAIGFATSDDASVVSAYDQEDPTFNYSFVEDTETPFISESGPSSLETITAYYLANISEVTPAGGYTTSLTYVATANF